MIYFTGDIHGDPFERFSSGVFPEGRDLTKNDYVVIAGDFGCIWKQEMSDEEQYRLEWLNNKPWTTLFVDGNHECHSRLNSYPVEEWHGGKVHKIMPSVIHLMRGEIYDINGYSLFAFGGARSHDIKDGILEIDDPLLQKWRYDWYRMFRINNFSWWKEEVPTSDEMQYALDNLAKHNWKVDYIVTHERPTFIYPKHYKPNVLCDYLEIIRQATNFGTWISGHHHENIVLDKYAMLYERIIPIFDNNDNEHTYHHNDIVFDKEWFQKRLDDEYNEIMERKNRP